MRKTLSVSIPEELFDKLQEYSDEMYMSKSQVLCSFFVEGLKQREVVKAMKSLAYTLAKMQDDGQLSDHDKEEIKKCCNVVEQFKEWGI